MKARVLFVCVENSCRSQMAEGFARALASDVLDAASAGSRPCGFVHPKAVEHMREAGIDVSKNRSKSLSSLPPGEWDYVVTMGCGDQCPWVKAKRRVDWTLPDPKHLPPHEFRKARDDIRARVEALAREVRAAAG